MKSKNVFISLFSQLILGILSTARTISVPYEDIHLAFPAATELIYTASTFDASAPAFNPDFSGYSYTTQDLNGGGSNVVFATGADSVNKLKQAMNSIHATGSMTKMPEKYTQRDRLDNIKDNTQKNPVPPEQQFKPEIAAIMNKQEDLVVNDVVSDEERKLSKNPEVDDSFLQHRAPSQEILFVRGPYPMFRVENFLNLQLPAMLPRYHASSNVIQNQYYPYNSFADLQLPLHDFNVYNPSAPLFYQAPITVNQVPVNSFSYDISTAVKDTTISMKANITKSSRTNTTQSASYVESTTIESRSNIKAMTKKDEEASSNELALSILESVISPKGVNEEMTIKSEKSTIKPRYDDQVETTTESSTANVTEFANTEISTSTKEPSTETSTLSATEI